MAIRRNIDGNRFRTSTNYRRLKESKKMCLSTGRNQTTEFFWGLYCLVVLFLLVYVICATKMAGDEQKPTLRVRFKEGSAGRGSTWNFRPKFKSNLQTRKTKTWSARTMTDPGRGTGGWRFRRRPNALIRRYMMTKCFLTEVLPLKNCI